KLYPRLLPPPVPGQRHKAHPGKAPGPHRASLPLNWNPEIAQQLLQEFEFAAGPVALEEGFVRWLGVSGEDEISRGQLAGLRRNANGKDMAKKVRGRDE